MLFRIIVSSIVCVGLVGCGSKLNVIPVTQEDIQPAMKEGIYFALPKTRLEVNVSFSVTPYTKGKYYGVFEECYYFCKEKIDKECEIMTEDTSDAEVLIKSISITPQIVRDTNHQYRMDIDLELFNKATHIVTLTQNGILMSADNTIGNSAAELGVEAIRFAATMLPVMLLDRPVADDAYKPSVPITIARNSLECTAIENTYDKIKKYNESIENTYELKKAKEAKNTFFATTGSRADIKVMEKILSHYDQKIEEKTKEIKHKWILDHSKDEIKATTQALTSSKLVKDKIKNYVLKAIIEPKEFEPFDSRYNASDKIAWELYEIKHHKLGDETIIKNERVYNADILEKYVNEMKYRITINPLKPYVFYDSNIADAIAIAEEHANTDRKAIDDAKEEAKKQAKIDAQATYDATAAARKDVQAVYDAEEAAKKQAKIDAQAIDKAKAGGDRQTIANAQAIAASNATALAEAIANAQAIAATNAPAHAKTIANAQAIAATNATASAEAIRDAERFAIDRDADDVKAIADAQAIENRTPIEEARSTEENADSLRYRIPVLAEITFYNDTKELFKTKRHIAQYGPLAYLPNQFYGSEHTINLSIFPETSGIKQVKIGSVPIGASTLKDATETIGEGITAYKDKDLKELEREALELQYKKEKLEYQKEIDGLTAD